MCVSKYYLAIVTNPGDPSRRAELVRCRWNLTQREAEILVHLASGGSNKTLAASLDCAVRMIARFWSELGA